MLWPDAHKHRLPKGRAATVRRYADTFEYCDVIVAPSGSCVGSVRHQHPMVARAFGDERLAQRAEAAGRATFELSQLLVDVLGVDDVGAYYPHRVTCHPTCHSLRMPRVGDRPLRLLRRVEGLDLVELPDAEVCCGFGGTFALKNSDTSTAMLADKMRRVLDTRAATQRPSGRAGSGSRWAVAGASASCRRRWRPGHGHATRPSRQPRPSGSGGATSTGGRRERARRDPGPHSRRAGRWRRACPACQRPTGQPAAGHHRAGTGSRQHRSQHGSGQHGSRFRTRGNLAPGPLLDLLAERLADYRALVRRAAPAELGAAAVAALAERGARGSSCRPASTGQRCRTASRS